MRGWKRMERKKRQRGRKEGERERRTWKERKKVDGKGR